MISVPVSIGEVFDKISILLIKKEKINHFKDKIDYEINLLQECVSQYDLDQDIFENLKFVNQTLWDIEDKIREKEKASVFDDEFIQLARSVYILNDKRAKIKKQINEKFNSVIQEFKSYKDY